MKKVFVLIAFSTLVACNRSERKQEVKSDTTTTLIQKGDSLKASQDDLINSKADPCQHAKIEVSTFPVEKGGFGYTISINGKPAIYQPFPPAWGGEKGFLSQKDAQKVGEFVAKKIVNKEMPPVVQMEDYKKLNIQLPQ